MMENWKKIDEKLKKIINLLLKKLSINYYNPALEIYGMGMWDEVRVMGWGDGFDEAGDGLRVLRDQNVQKLKILSSKGSKCPKMYNNA